jgi:single-stranded-DNA-specific exonuclease
MKNPSRFRWKYPDSIPETVASNLDSFSRPFQAILHFRGCNTMQDALSFLLPPSPSISPSQDLRHLDIACNQITATLESDQLFAVYGDYDADGITATALLTLALREIGAKVIPYIPRRVSEGYGLNSSAIDALHQQGVKTLITVDNGIRSHTEISHARSLGMDVIITDHHQPPVTLPAADAIINPKLPDDAYPNKNLAGVGVVYKLVCKLAERHKELLPEDYLDLVAIGTVADIVPLVGENRYLVKQGLRLINRQTRQAIQSLVGASGLGKRDLTASDISFQLAPRINSSGRLADNDDYLAPLDLLLSSDPAICGNLAQILDNHNLQRKSISRKMLERIEGEITATESSPPILFSFDQENLPGVAGIAAGVLTNRYYLPSIVGAVGEHQTIASCRSIPEFDIISALSHNKDLFTRFGGHKLAAGFTVKNSKIAVLRENMTKLAEDQLGKLDLSPTLEIDAVVTLSELDHSLYQELAKIEPTGEGNPTPVFAIKNASADRITRVGKGKEHLKLLISDGTGSMPAIGFGFGDIFDSLPDGFNLAGFFTVNEFRGNKEYQIRIADIESAD